MAENKNKKKQSLWAEAWSRLCRNPRAMISLIFLVLLILAAIFAEHLTPYTFDKISLAEAEEGFSMKHLLGTDDLGRDMLTRILVGARYSLSIGIISVGISLFVGGFFGAIAGYYGGIFDTLIMRFNDIWQTIPSMLMAIVLASTLGTGIGTTMIAIGFSHVPVYARLLRSCVLTVRSNEYIEAAQVVRASDFRIITTHIVPNILSSLIVQSTLNVGSSILSAAALSYVGLGAQLPIPEWGAMLSHGKDFIRTTPLLTVIPGVAIMLTVLSLNLLGDGLRDALDPKLRK